MREELFTGGFKHQNMSEEKQRREGRNMVEERGSGNWETL